MLKSCKTAQKSRIGGKVPPVQNWRDEHRRVTKHKLLLAEAKARLKSSTNLKFLQRGCVAEQKEEVCATCKMQSFPVGRYRLFAYQHRPEAHSCDSRVLIESGLLHGFGHVVIKSKS